MKIEAAIRVPRKPAQPAISRRQAQGREDSDESFEKKITRIR